MKSSLALILASLLAAPLLYAQGTGVTNPPSGQPASGQAIPLIPQAPPADNTAQTPGALDPGQKKDKKQAGPSRTDAAEDAMQLHIKLRAAKTKALMDPVIQAELAKVARRKTDYEIREAYKRYYVLLYARMLQIDPSLAAGITLREASSVARTYQYRIYPTVPIDQVGQSEPTGPENALIPAGGTLPPRRHGQGRSGSAGTVGAP